MRHFNTVIIFILMLSSLMSYGEKEENVEIIISKDTDAVERFAALELQDYLKQLFNISAIITNLPSDNAEYYFFLSNQENNSLLSLTVSEEDLPKLSEQGFLLQKTIFMEKPAVIIRGGSSNATMWGVYELVEHYGVRYLLHGDVCPKDKGNFHLPTINKVFEPLLRTRWWRVLNVFAMGPESWGMADYRVVIGQLAKLKFNRIDLAVWPWQPFLDLEIKGIKRKSASLWFNFHYPITDDMPGREIFPDKDEFWNPDLPIGASYEEFADAGERLCHNLIAYAHSRGMEASFSVGSVMDFPKEFTPLIPGAQVVKQVGNLTVGPGSAVKPDNKNLTEICGEVVKIVINTYPDADLYTFGMPEHRGWTERYEWAWQKLDKKYHIGQIISLKEVLEKAKRRTSYPGGAERAITEVKGDLVSLYFLDRLLTSPEVLPKSQKPEARIAISGGAEELFPIIPRVLPKISEARAFVDYTASRVVNRREVLRNFPVQEVPASLIFTLHDDNVGVLPQLATGSLHKLACDLKKNGWNGFSTRYWMISDHDPCVAYLSKTAWNSNVTPEEVYADQIRIVCGENAVEPMLEAFSKLETVTKALEEHALGLSFPKPNMMMKHWNSSSFPIQLAEDRKGYRQALSAVRKVPEPSGKEGKDYIDYWLGRLEFGIGYLNTIEAVKNAATAEEAANEARKKEDWKSYRLLMDLAIEQGQVALKTAYEAISVFAAVAKNQSDRGAIAIMNDYVYRTLKDKIAKLKLNEKQIQQTKDGKT